MTCVREYFTEVLYFRNSHRYVGLHINQLMVIEANLSGCIYVFENSYPVSLLVSLSHCNVVVKRGCCGKSTSLFSFTKTTVTKWTETMAVSSAMPSGDIKQKADGTYDFYNHSKTFNVFYDQNKQQYPINTQTGLTQIGRLLAEVH